MSDYQGNIVIKNPATPTGPTAGGRAPGMWKLSEVAYWIKQGVWPDANIPAADAFFPYVSLLLSTTSLGNANNNLFVDSSGAFNPVTRIGNPTQGAFSPYSTNWSNYFNGTNSRVSVANNAAFGFGTGDFTVEFWLYYMGGNGYKFFFVNNSGSGNYVGYGLQVGTLTPWVWNNGDVLVASSNITPNTWQHHAVVRSGSTLTIYLNGTAIGSTTWTTDIGSSRPFYIGWNGGNDSQSTPGYFSNFRVVKGTAVYTSNFTPPTAPLTAISGTGLLTCQSNRFIDNSGNNLAITVYGDTRVTDFAPFSPAYPGAVYNQSDITNWSMYSDGTGDSLVAPANAAFAFGTGDFTIEFWAYIPSWTSEAQLIGAHTAFVGYDFNVQQWSSGEFRWLDSSLILQSGYAPPTNQWNHYAITRSGTTLRIFVNGVQRASGTSTANIGSNRGVGMLGDTGGAQSQIGYMSNVRIVKGTAVYTSNFTPPTSPLTAISGTSLLTCQNAAFTDNSTNNFVITQNGNPTVTGNSPFNTVGYWSNYFDGNGDYLQITSAAALQFGTGDFTVEFWLNLIARDTSGAAIFNNYNSFTTGALGFFAGHASANTGKYQVAVNGTFPAIQSSANVTYGQWDHFAIVRNGNTLTLYINGVADGTFSVSGITLNGVGSYWWLGSAQDAPSNYETNGYLSNFRVVKGTAVYTANFTPPTTPLTAITNTSLLTCQNGRFIDNSTNAFTITANGNTSIQSFDPFYTSTIASNGGSMYFDGTGDYLSVPASPSLTFGTGDFTIEMWLYSGANSTSTRLAGNGAGAGWGANKWVMGTGYAGSANKFFMSVNNGGTLLTSTTTFNDSAWHHAAVTRSGNTWRLFVDGVQEATLTSSVSVDGGVAANISIGSGQISGDADWAGFISNFRIVKGTAVYTAAFTPPTAPVTPTPATTLLANGMNAGVYDATTINDMETVGNAQVSTVQSKFGGSSVYFGGLNNWLDFPANPTADFGTGDITIECWLYVTSTATSYQSICQFGNAAVTSGFHILTNNNTICLRTNNSQPLTTSGTITANTWNHIALTRASGTTRIFINGTTSGGTYNWTASLSSGSTRRIGGDIYSNALTGYIDDFRVTAGVARYTSNFTPPTQAFPTY